MIVRANASGGNNQMNRFLSGGGGFGGPGGGGRLSLEIRGEAVRSELDFRALELLPYTRTGNFAYAYPPGVPANMVATAREAIQKAFQDPELRESYVKALGIELQPLDGKTTQETMEATLARFNASPEVLERTRQIARGGN